MEELCTFIVIYPLRKMPSVLPHLMIQVWFIYVHYHVEVYWNTTNWFRILGQSILAYVKDFPFFFDFFLLRWCLCSPGCPGTWNIYSPDSPETQRFTCLCFQNTRSKGCATTNLWVKLLCIYWGDHMVCSLRSCDNFICLWFVHGICLHPWDKFF